MTLKAIIAGGGTGGHLFPGVALAEEITTRQAGNEVLFVGTERGLEARVIPELGYPLELIEVRGLKGKGVSARLQGLARIPVALVQSFRILSEFQPDVAIGVGGYASGPLILAAWMRGIPTAVLEQNTVPGVTNRILGRFVRAVFVMFEASRAFFPADKVQVYGNPIRRQLLDNFLQPSSPREERFRILILGGSQGAHSLNLYMLEALESLDRSRYRIVHQTGRKDEAEVRDRYLELGFDAEVRAFIEDMSGAYRQTDLVVCRAGATTLAEVMVAQRAAVLVPFPHATDNHQELNGQAMVDAGAALMFPERDLDGARLAAAINELASDPDRLSAMEAASASVGRPEAAREIIDFCVGLVGETP
ncbi:MAG: undecaprenyldiphospho-muramoylpentapeptide beta-N-acetylglucosaminyltransferase [Myxococcota bacterium]